MVFPSNNKDRQIYIGDPYPKSGSSYSISTDERVLTVRLSSSADGPFYQTNSQCSASDSDSHLRFFYRIHNLEWKFFYKSNCDPSIRDYLRRRAWYPQLSGNLYRVCFVKVKVEIVEATEITVNEIKIRVFSYGGTSEHIKDKILGIHEATMEESKKSYCIEYKCSGIIDSCNPLLDDQTKVNVILEYPSRKGICKVNEIAKEQADIYGNTQCQSNGQFSFNAKIDDGDSEKGIYSGVRRNIADAKRYAKAYCETTVISPEAKSPTDIGYAVAFRCENN